MEADMLEADDAPSELEDLFKNYGMTLFCANETEDFSVFKTELRQMLEVIPCRRDKRKLVALAQRSEYHNLDKDTFEVIAALTNNSKMMECADEYENQEGGYDMCQALKDMVEEGRAEGITLTLLENVHSLMEALHYTAEQAMDVLKVSEEVRINLRAKL